LDALINFYQCYEIPIILTTFNHSTLAKKVKSKKGKKVKKEVEVIEDEEEDVEDISEPEPIEVV
jgi:hypothetical protein